ncbi:thioredoxin H9 [Artemisia annua]|uniref:Thioredoxin H9 n=1 Tax=Artemisia annua TaxID=35608 RepID=A0A2U1N3Y1_ARTAN|nr:thioredoxin H9 [Artemisia annua]
MGRCPCRAIAPIFCDLAAKHDSLMFLTVDVDELTEFSTSWEIKATPTFFFLKDGQQVDRLVGANEEELIKKTEAAELMLTLVSRIRGHGSVPTFVMKKNLKILSKKRNHNLKDKFSRMCLRDVSNRATRSKEEHWVAPSISQGLNDCIESAVILMKFMEVNKTNRLAASELKQRGKYIHVIAGFYMDYD